MFALRRSHALSPGSRLALPFPEAPFTLRTGSHDVRVFGQVFLYQQYRLRNVAPRVIIDGGAHIGCATVDFAQRYPTATIVAVEANRDNFELLQENTRAYRNVRCVHGAIWPRREGVHIANPDGDTWAFRCEGGGDLAGHTIGDLLGQIGADRLDILKLDIEGAEREVFLAQNARQWIRRTDRLLVELHDHLSPGCGAALDALLSDGHWRRRRQDETLVVERA
jgi:FkbM family methyltransferase